MGEVALLRLYIINFNVIRVTNLIYLEYKQQSKIDMTIFEQLDEDVLFPSSDGKAMVGNTEQYRWIVIIKENLEILFAGNENIFIAGNLLWYPVHSQLISPTAPDVMVIFGRPKGKRSSYRQWNEENIAPQVVFEIISPSNDAKEMERKLEFYNTYGIEEYYIYNPQILQFDGWIRQNGNLTKLWETDGFVSPRMGIKFETGQGELIIYRPDGQKFLSSVELEQRFQEERIRRERAELLLEQERQRAEQMADYLRSIGVDPDDIGGS